MSRLPELNQKGAVPVLILVAVIGVISFLSFSFFTPFKNTLFSSIFPKDPSKAAETSAWYMAGANPQRTSWVPEGPKGQLTAKWIVPLEAYVSKKVQVIGASGMVFVSTAKGLYAFDATTGAEKWVFPTEMPLGNSPTVVNGVAYVGGFDRKVYAINITNGQKIWEATGGDGFHANPLVFNNRVYLGNRDGYFYAFDATNGNTVWTYPNKSANVPPLNGTILHSAAASVDLQTIYFTANDGHVYALNSSNGTLKWKSNQFENIYGFHSWWPVVYKNYLVLTNQVNIRDAAPGKLKTELGMDSSRTLIFPESRAEDYVGVRGNAPGDWVAGETTMDLSTNVIGGIPITQYLEDDPQRRALIFLDTNTGQEVSWDYDNDGKPDYAPVIPNGRKGNIYPPVVGYDNVLYMHNVYKDSGFIKGSGTTGLKVGTPIVSLPYSSMTSGSGEMPEDEPVGWSAGGTQIYWNLCCYRFLGGLDLSIPNTTFPLSSSTRQWRYGDIANSWQLPGFDSQKNQYLFNLTQTDPIYCGSNPQKCDRFEHADNAGPAIYNNMVYAVRANALVALGSGTTGTVLPVSTIRNTTQPTVLTRSDVQKRLEAEVQKILDAGHLRPGFWSSGASDLRLAALVEDFPDYFHNPADTQYFLLRALPHLPSAMQTQLKAYLQSEYANYPPYKFAHIGWATGAGRESLNIIPRIETEMSTMGVRTDRYQFGFTDWTFPPQNWYALWQYVKVFGNAKSIFDTASLSTNNSSKAFSNLPNLTDAHLISNPHIINAYIAGLTGFLELEKLAGYPESAGKRADLNRLLSLRAANIKWDVFTDNTNTKVQQFYWTMIPSWNFLFMTPELSQFIQTNSLATATQAIKEYEHRSAYWFVSKSEESQDEEAGYLPLYNYHALFQAKAKILNEPFEELSKHLDAPAFERGDLFYIDNLVSTLEAPSSGSSSPIPSPSPLPSSSPIPGDIDGSRKVDIFDYNALITNFGRSGTGLTGDLDSSGKVDIFDYNILITNFGRSG